MDYAYFLRSSGPANLARDAETCALTLNGEGTEVMNTSMSPGIALRQMLEFESGIKLKKLLSLYKSSSDWLLSVSTHKCFFPWTMESFLSKNVHLCLQS